jgi:hypothetical protein
MIVFPPRSGRRKVTTEQRAARSGRDRRYRPNSKCLVGEDGVRHHRFRAAHGSGVKHSLQRCQPALVARGDSHGRRSSREGAERRTPKLDQPHGKYRALTCRTFDGGEDDHGAHERVPRVGKISLERFLVTYFAASALFLVGDRVDMKDHR